MDVRQILGDVEYEVAEVLAAIALQADSGFNAGVPQVDHAVFGEEADEPGDVEDAALRRVVGVSDDCFIVVLHLALGYLPRVRRRPTIVTVATARCIATSHALVLADEIVDNGPPRESSAKIIAM